ncbi:hypothetical protein [Nostoc sp. DedSLP04]|uniref:hypothetical protein n=1 Tax=Nostoc sp. DedSLP04 TaxID=3075401 RepID=UPI002AD398ED|nr:hypothetical protein [Nostoc sp. DedSLP04]
MSSAVGGLNMLPDVIASRLETFFKFAVLKSPHPEIAIASPLTNIDFSQDIRR